MSSNCVHSVFNVDRFIYGYI
jgi:ATP-binding cassette, subfamily A (ABC1), member 3